MFGVLLELEDILWLRKIGIEYVLKYMGLF